MTLFSWVKFLYLSFSSSILLAGFVFPSNVPISLPLSHLGQRPTKLIFLSPYGRLCLCFCSWPFRQALHSWCLYFLIGFIFSIFSFSSSAFITFSLLTSPPAVGVARFLLESPHPPSLHALHLHASLLAACRLPESPEPEGQFAPCLPEPPDPRGEFALLARASKALGAICSLLARAFRPRGAICFLLARGGGIAGGDRSK